MNPAINPNQFFDPSSLPLPGGIGEGIGTVIETGESLLEQFQQLGLSTHAIMAVVLIGGLLLWIFGGKSLKAGFGLLGMLVGAQLGLFAPAAIGYDTPPVIVAITGGALGLLLGMVAFRMTVAWTMAVLLGVLGLIGSAAYFEVRPQWNEPTQVAVDPERVPTAEERITEEMRRILEDYRRRLPSLPMQDGLVPTEPQPDTPEDDPEARERYERRIAAAQEGARQLSEVLLGIREQLRPTWEQLETREKTTIIAIALLGNVVGFSIGLLATKKSAMLITAFAGPLIWVPSAIWLAAALDLPGLSHLPSDPLVWALVWFVLSVVGIAIQWRRPKD